MHKYLLYVLEKCNVFCRQNANFRKLLKKTDIYDDSLILLKECDMNILFTNLKILKNIQIKII